MSDPFSILAGAVSLADVCVRTVKFLKAARAGIHEIDSDIQNIISELDSLRNAQGIITSTYKLLTTGERGKALQAELSTHWTATRDTLTGCTGIVEQLEAFLRSVISAGGREHGKIDQLRRWSRYHSNEKTFVELRQKLTLRYLALQMILDASNVLLNKISHETSGESIINISRSMDELGRTLTTKIESLRDSQSTSSDVVLETAIDAAKKIANNTFINEHFHVPVSVASSFTGRDQEFEILREHLIPSPTKQECLVQRRFVLYGLAGSGKTQTCCKFALNNRNSFWGIFWLNASSKEHLRQSFASLAEIPRVTPNESAVKGWLSSLGSNKPWLLIIDNADDADTFIEQSFPDNIYGSILITTRSPSLRAQGTVGPRYLEFSGLDEQVSINLLLRLADEAMPWTVQAVDSASKIAEKVGCLPLALTYAGITIASRLCTLQTYIDFYERCWTRLRQVKNSQVHGLPQDASAVIYGSYEALYESLSSKGTQASADGLVLLKIFSFLDRQNIRLAIFTRAANNPVLEQASAKTEDDWHDDSRPQRSWSKFLKGYVVEFIKYLTGLGFRPVVPAFLSASSSMPFDEFRLREAVNELLRISLISVSSAEKDAYTMHAAVHFWARQRPQMSLVDQAVWCQITSTILSRAILLPPLDDTEEEEAFRRELLPHVAHAQKMEGLIEEQFSRNRQSRKQMFPFLSPPINSDRLVQLVKFSLVYYEGRQLEDAERLQLSVLNFLLDHLGVENAQTIAMLRLLSRTYFQLAKMDEAVKLQERAYNACLAVFGRTHSQTLQVMDQYGSALWLQGHFKSSRVMHTAAVELLTKKFGSHDILTLKAMGGLGRALSKDFAFQEAIDTNTFALHGLIRERGPTHSATLEAMDNLAMSYFDRTAYRQGQLGDLDYALELEQKVFDLRVQRLGKEHYHTLWAGLNLARIHAVRGETDEALAIITPGLAIVKRDMAPDHFLSLFTNLHYSRILMCANQHQIAEQILTGILAIYPATRRKHPDRLLVLYSLIKCRRVLGISEGVDDMYQQLVDGVIYTFGPSHAAVATITDKDALSATTSDLYGGKQLTSRRVMLEA